MPYVLIKYSEDWADEFQVEGFAIVEKTFWEQYKQDIYTFAWPQVKYFGTNQGMQWPNAESYLANFSAIEIPKFIATILADLFGLEISKSVWYQHTYGTILLFEDEPSEYQNPRKLY